MVPAIRRITVERGAYVLTTTTTYIPRDRLNRSSLLHGDGASIIPKVPGQRPVQPALGLDVAEEQLLGNRRESFDSHGGREAVRTPKKNV